MSTISAYLKQQNISGLYHFTEVQNLHSIFGAGALLSYYQIQQKGISVKTGGDAVSLSIAAQKNLSDFISLSFSPYTPMSSMRKMDHHLCFLIFRREVADLPGILFCNGNANANRTQRIPGVLGAQNLNFTAIKNGVAPGNGVWHDAARSEILVPQSLSLDYLEKVVFVNHCSMEQGAELNASGGNYSLTVDRDMFFIDPSVDREIAFNTIESVVFENCRLEGSTYYVDRAEVSEIVLRIRIQAFGRMKLIASTSCKGFRQAWEGAYMGIVEATNSYTVTEMVNNEYLFNIWLDGSFWRRRVVMVN